MYGRYYRVMIVAYSFALFFAYEYFSIAFALVAIFCMIETAIILSNDVDSPETFWFLWGGITIILVLRIGLFEWIRPITFVNTDVETYLLLASTFRATVLCGAIVAGLASVILNEIKKPLL